MVEVGRCTDTVRIFGLEPFGQPRIQRRGGSPHGFDVQVFVVGLRGAVAARITDPQSDLLAGTVTDVCPGAKHHVLHEVVLVEACPDEQTQFFGFPLVLQVTAGDMGLLRKIAVEAHVVIVQVVVVVFGSRRSVPQA